jgi:hypothetical protein
MADMYFKHDTWAARFFRFLNLLEPGPKMVLSISKAYLWASVFVLVWVAVTSPENVTALVAAGANQFIAIGNYAFRRVEQRKAKESV